MSITTREFERALFATCFQSQRTADVMLVTLNIVASEHREDIAFLHDFYRVRAGLAPLVWNKIRSKAA